MNMRIGVFIVISPAPMRRSTGCRAFRARAAAAGRGNEGIPVANRMIGKPVT